MKQGWSETQIEALLAETAERYDSTHGNESVTEGNIREIDLMSDAAGPEYLTAQDVRTLLGIPRSDRYSFDGE